MNVIDDGENVHNYFTSMIMVFNIHSLQDLNLERELNVKLIRKCEMIGHKVIKTVNLHAG